MNFIKHTTKRMYRSLRVWPAVILCGVMLVLSGCSSDEFLTPNPSSFTTTVNFYETPEHFESALNAVYEGYRSFASIQDTDFRIWSEMRTDAANRQFDPNLPGIDTQNVLGWFMQVSNATGINTWSTAYEAIYRANIVTTRIDDIEWDDAAQRDRILAEARFLRAATYYWLVQIYGDTDGSGVVLRTEETSGPGEALDATLSSRDAILNQVTSDLNAAIGNLYDKGDADWQNGRVTNDAANYLLGKTLLLTGDYPGAITAFGTITGYSLLPTYLDVFDPTNNGNDESIWELSYADNVPGQPNRNPEWVIPHHLADNDALSALDPALEGVDGDNEGIYPSFQVWDYYTDTANDERYQTGWTWSVHSTNGGYPEVAHTPSSASTDSIPTSNKWFWLGSMDGDDLDGNEVVFRYADVVLSLAEAHWQRGNAGDDATAIGYINDIRARADLGATSLATLDTDYPVPGTLVGTYLETDDVGRAIFMERTIEFLLEGYRSSDLIRFSLYNDDTYGFAQTVLQAAHDSRVALEGEVEGQTSFDINANEIPWPLPPTEILNSEGDIPQNSGYN